MLKNLVVVNLPRLSGQKILQKNLVKVATRRAASSIYRYITPAHLPNSSLWGSQSKVRNSGARSSSQLLSTASMSSASDAPGSTASEGQGSEKKTPRLTELSLGGGCGCKISPGKLQEILKKVHLDFGPSDRLLVGAGGSDDAAVYQLSPEQAVVVTTDFFMPIVDDPRDFGRVAAANAISDVYAMGGRPLLALSVLGMPVSVLSPETIQEILNGGVDICKAAGIPLAGGHSIDSREPIFGLVVTGVLRPDRLRRNNTPKEGDNLILTKPLGVGVLTTACRKGRLDDKGYHQVMCSMLQLNSVGADLVEDDVTAPHVHAMTDVTGFGLLGHLLEMVRAPGTSKGQGSSETSPSLESGSGVVSTDERISAVALKAVVHVSRVPFLDSAVSLAQERVLPGAVSRNWASYGDRVSLAADVELWQRDLLSDPQTSGGLLIAAAPGAATEAVLKAAAASHRRQTEQRLAAGDVHAGAVVFEPRVIGKVVAAGEGEAGGVDLEL